MDNDNIKKYENNIIKEKELNKSEYNQTRAKEKITDKNDSKGFNINIKNNINNNSKDTNNKIEIEKNNVLNIDPPKTKFTFNGYSYLPYNNTRILENRQTYTYICNIYRKDYNKRKGLEKLCNAKYKYDIKSKSWSFEGPHSQYCKEIHNNNNNDKFNFNSLKYIDFEKVLFEKLNQNLFMKLSEFKNIAEDIIKDKKYEFKIFESTYTTIYNK